MLHLAPRAINCDAPFWPPAASKQSGADAIRVNAALSVLSPAPRARGRVNAKATAATSPRRAPKAYFMKLFISERAREAHAKLELAAAAVESIGVNRNAIIQTQWADWQVQAQPNAPVIKIVGQMIVVRIQVDVANVIE